MDEMWSYVQKKSEPRWLWYAIDHNSSKVLAYVLGRRKDKVFQNLKSLQKALRLNITIQTTGEPIVGTLSLKNI